MRAGAVGYVMKRDATDKCWRPSEQCSRRPYFSNAVNAMLRKNSSKAPGDQPAAIAALSEVANSRCFQLLGRGLQHAPDFRADECGFQNGSCLLCPHQGKAPIWPISMNWFSCRPLARKPATPLSSFL